jgi:hypothetical protein
MNDPERSRSNSRSENLSQKGASPQQQRVLTIKKGRNSTMMKAFLQNQRRGNSESGGLKPIIEAYEGGETARHKQDKAEYLKVGCNLLDKKPAK